MSHLNNIDMTIDRRKLYLISGVAVIFALIAIHNLSSGEGSVDKAGRNSPENTLENFYAAMKTGDFETAMNLCDSTSLHGYLSAYKQSWQEMTQKDSAEFAAIASILANTELVITEAKEEDGVCFMSYTLTMDGMKKQCNATVKKEEGEWKVATITNGI